MISGYQSVSVFALKQGRLNEPALWGTGLLLALAVGERQWLEWSRLLRGGFGFSPFGGGVDAPAVVVAARLTFGLAGNGRFEALDA